MRKVTRMLLTGILSAAVCLSNGSVVFAEDTAASSSSSVLLTEDQTGADTGTGQDAAGENQNALSQSSTGSEGQVKENAGNTDGTDSENAGAESTDQTSGSGADSTEENQDQTTEENPAQTTDEDADQTESVKSDSAEEEDTDDPDDKAAEAVQLSDDIGQLVTAAAQITDYSPEQVDQISQKMDEVQSSLDTLPAEEQNILSESAKALDNAAAAVDAYQEPAQTAHFLVEDDGHQNSFRFLNGQLVDDAMQDVSQESDAIQAYADGESDAVVQGLKDGTITTNQGEASVSRQMDDDTQAILVGSSSSAEGIDVSQWQGSIDWASVKNAGISFAILRCGYGEDIASQDDGYWEYNAKQCEKFNIPYGVYLYSYATDTTGAASEASHVLRLLNGHRISLPVYIDVEEHAQYALGSGKLVPMVSTFCSTISAAGYSAGIYSSTSWWDSVLAPLAGDTTYYHWVAQWNDRVTASAVYQMWQYTDKGAVSGISGNVDRDRWYGNVPDSGVIQTEDEAPGVNVEYQTHVQNIGWESSVRSNGASSGTTGRALRLEAIRIRVTGDSNLGVSYSTHVQNIGWQNAVSDWNASGTTGRGLRLEAIRINLTGADADKYDIYYRVHAQNIGWMGWAKDGEAAGTAGYGYRLEAIQIAVLEKGASAPSNTGAATSSCFRQVGVTYSTHVQNIGWQGSVNDGSVSGTTGRSLRLEGIKISSPVADLEYRTHVQNIGWESGWTSAGGVSGTTGRSLRLEAIQIRLKGASASQYDIYYRVHVQNFGWTGWASNGASCGSAGYGYRLEAIQIVLVGKGGTAPGSTANTFYQR